MASQDQRKVLSFRTETYEGDMRITLERDTRNIPFAITCGIGGWMVHTCYFSTEEQARTAYDLMKCDLVRLYDLIPDAHPDPPQSAFDVLYQEMHNFVRHYS